MNRKSKPAQAALWSRKAVETRVARMAASAPGAILATTAAHGAKALPDLEHIAGVWRGADWHAVHGRAANGQQVWPSGHAALDAELPGGGWPVNALVQVQQAAYLHAEWALLLPALAGLVAQGHPRQQLVLVAPPYLPFAPALQAAGIAPEQLCCVYPPAGSVATDMAWACEQALHSGDVLAVLAWLPGQSLRHSPWPPTALRRLQWAAASQGRPLWLWESLPCAASAMDTAAGHSSPAALRLRLERADATVAEAESLQLHILKRRGPVLEKPVLLTPSHWAWMPVLQAQAQRRACQAAEAELLLQSRSEEGRALTTPPVGAMAA